MTDMQQLINPQPYHSCVFSQLTKLHNDNVSSAFNSTAINTISAEQTKPLNKNCSLNERLYEATARIKILIAKLSMHMEQEWRSNLFRQIDFLHTPEDWQEEDAPANTESFANFLKALLDIKPHLLPGLGLTYEGNIIAAWTTGKDRLTLEFLPNGHVQWVMSICAENEAERLGGKVAVSRLRERLSNNDLQRWFVHDSRNATTESA
ncbi:MAG: hypothetical protein ABTQ34_02965 [Bdellovibrionales bacterium]